MTEWHGKSRRKVTGGMLSTVRARDRRRYEMGGEPSNTTIVAGKEPKRQRHKTMGNTSKVKLLHDKFIYAAHGGKVKKFEIIQVVENDADRQFARRNIITKGAVLSAKDGSKEVSVRVTSRPGQSGDLMGVILDKFIKKDDLKKNEKKEQKAKNVEKHKAKHKEKDDKTDRKLQDKQ